MGLDNENAARLVFDIETAPLPEAAEYLEPVEAPSHYKDPLKIEAYKVEKQAEHLERCGLDVDLCRVVAIGLWSEDQPEPTAWTVFSVSEERDLLIAFWRTSTQRHLVGFNCLNFDLPVLLRRSLYLDVPTPRIGIDRFKHPDVTDLMQELSFNGKLTMRSLSFYCKRFGFDVPDHMVGAGIAQAVEEGRWADIEAHVKADVQKTSLLAAKLGHFSRMLAGGAA